MPRLPELPEGDRFFARVLGARLECPRCGYIDQFETKGSQAPKGVKARGKGPKSGWDPMTSRWRCPSCGMVFTLGLLAWPVEPGSAPATLPKDQVPDWRQLAQLRAQAEGQGLWMREAVRRWRPDASNVTQGCSCVPAELARDPACVVHGDPPEGAADPLSPPKTTP